MDQPVPRERIILYSLIATSIVVLSAVLGYSWWAGRSITAATVSPTASPTLSVSPSAEPVISPIPTQAQSTNSGQAFTEVGSGSLGSVTKLKNTLVSNDSQFKALTNAGLNAKLPADFDFSTDSLILLVYGGPTTGYSPQVKSIDTSNGTVTINYDQLTPGSGCVNGQAITNAYQLIRTTKINQTITFNGTVVKNTPCN